MTFAPDFQFYRDGRALDLAPPDDFWDAMKQEAHDMHVHRSLTYPGMAAKGRMSHADAERELRIARAIAEDWGAAPRSPGFPIATWAEMVHGLRREIAIRRKLWPRRVEAGQMPALDADRRTLLLEQWHDLLWHLPYNQAAIAARAAAAQALAMRAAA